MGEIKNKLLFFPSLSVGEYSALMEKNFRINDKTTVRFYDEDYTTPSLFHPYFLITAGHFYNIPHAREKWALNKDVLVMGDSGGYQIATGVMKEKFSQSLLEKIFIWLENNSDLAFALDFPPRMKNVNDFKNSLEMSYQNFKYFDEHQSGKTKFLNILHGPHLTYNHMDTWYQRVKDLDFNGWGIGGVRNIDKAVLSMAFLLEKGEFEKPKRDYYHFLGVSSLDLLICLVIMQKELNDRYGDKVQITTDSSSPGLSTVFGTYYHSINWKNQCFNHIRVSKNSEHNEDVKLPCLLECDACENVTFKDISAFDKHQRAIFTLHNLNVFRKAIDQVDMIVNCNDDIKKDMFGSTFFNLYKIIHEIFASDKPISLYNKHHTFLKQFSNAVSTFDKEQVKEFFNF